MKKRFDGNILAVVPEYCSGPGWVNAPVWIIWQDGIGVIHEDCIQPDEQPPELVALFEIGAVVNARLKMAVEKIGERKP